MLPEQSQNFEGESVRLTAGRRQRDGKVKPSQTCLVGKEASCTAVSGFSVCLPLFDGNIAVFSKNDNHNSSLYPEKAPVDP